MSIATIRGQKAKGNLSKFLQTPAGVQARAAAEEELRKERSFSGVRLTANPGSDWANGSPVLLAKKGDEKFLYLPGFVRYEEVAHRATLPNSTDKAYALPSFGLVPNGVGYGNPEVEQVVARAGRLVSASWVVAVGFQVAFLMLLAIILPPGNRSILPMVATAGAAILSWLAFVSRSSEIEAAAYLVRTIEQARAEVPCPTNAWPGIRPRRPRLSVFKPQLDAGGGFAASPVIFGLIAAFLPKASIGLAAVTVVLTVLAWLILALNGVARLPAYGRLLKFFQTDRNYVWDTLRSVVRTKDLPGVGELQQFVQDAQRAGKQLRRLAIEDILAP